jgi:hypothetical protein
MIYFIKEQLIFTKMQRRLIMKKILVAGLVLVFGLALASDAFAQQVRRGCWGRADRYNRLYNPATVETISGTVTDVGYFSPAEGMAQGVHVLVRQPDGQTVDVQLGPRWYLDNQDITIKEGDPITVTGSRVTLNGEPVIIASEVRLNNEVLHLRNRQGYPLWAGWRSEPRQ